MHKFIRQEPHSHDLIISRRPHLQIPYIESRASTYEFGGDTNIQSITHNSSWLHDMILNPFFYPGFPELYLINKYVSSTYCVLSSWDISVNRRTEISALMGSLLMLGCMWGGPGLGPCFSFVSISFYSLSGFIQFRDFR